MYALQLGMGWFAEKGGGLDRYYHGLLQALPDVGVECAGLIAGLPSVEQESGGKVAPFASPGESLWRRWHGIRGHLSASIAARRPDLIASHFALYARPVLRMIRPYPHVVHFHGPWAAECRFEGSGRAATFLRKRLESRVYRSADRLIVLSDAFAKVLAGYGVDASRIRVIPGGIDAKRFALPLTRAEARGQLHWPTDRPIVLTVRRLVRRMGLIEFVTAAKQLCRTIPDTLVLIAGRGPLKETLEQQINDAGLKDKVRLLGFVPDNDLPLAYRAADLSVVPTVALEGFGLTAAESMAAGTPALVTPVAALPEVVRGLNAKLIFRDESPGAIADRVADALSGYAQMPSPESCRRFAERFDWSEVARKVRMVYDELAH